MAIGIDFIIDLIGLKNAGHISSRCSVMELGSQQLANNFFDYPDAIQNLLDAYELPHETFYHHPNKTAADRSKVHGQIEHLDPESPFAREFFEKLGFVYSAVDVDNHPNTIQLDLNFDRVPRKKRKMFDLVTNFGTTEHVCNQLNSFEIIHDFTKVGGIMHNALPMAGYHNHGFFSYNPKFFWMLCRANKYELLDLKVTQQVEPYELPENIRDSMDKYTLTEKNNYCDYNIFDLGLKVIMKKKEDLHFISPFDGSDDFVYGQFLGEDS